ncbi:MAG: photosynthetic reaction center cytochrome c subunit [Betaproteobacteria bacterium]|nr:photosynthetic reaction center cytochrome c subunit [Betaproteobacteria bacterium]
MKKSQLLLSAGLALLVLLTGCERPPTDTVQHGYRGTGMVQVYNPRTMELKEEENTIPPSLPALPGDGPKASQVYKNVKVLGNLSVNEFTRLMLSMTSWVAPTEGCAYCHNPANFAEDVKYTKVVARRMIEMTRHINADWKVHVAETGVTCYTCHRGNPVPNNIWHKEEEQAKGADFIGDRAGQNLAANSVVGTSLPSDPFTPFLLGELDIRVNGTTALPNGNRHSIKQAEWTYGLMTHMSSALGVNCTYCHNTQSFSNWNGNPPQRSTAWYGIRMARDLNKDYMEPLASVFPEHRLGPTGDAPKANCATCHQGAYKPLFGQSMLKDHPQLAGPGTGLDKTTLAKK